MKFAAINFTCSSCGAPQRFSPATGKMSCEFCNTQTAIDVLNYHIEEYDFKKALSNLKVEKSKIIEKKVSCKKCGASFVLTPYALSSNCPYCDTPAITEFIKEITPKSLLPFAVTHKNAQERFVTWVGSRWFAPNAFKKYLDGNKNLTGYYLPYWTYDSDTISNYRGLRGDVYYVTVTKTVTDNNGRQKQIQVQESRIRWTAASGVVYVNFDDITIGASKTVSRAILNALEPWDTNKLLPFDKKYLSGFKSEEYTIGLDNGFEFAKAKMASKIERNIRQDIGGDQQQIHSTNTQHNNVTYKNILLPVWVASFKWKNKTYNYAINAQTGKITGERPYSVTKIVFAVMGGVGGVGVIGYFEEIRMWMSGLMAGM
ncbi:MAG: primosomal protein N' (replication factor Y) - superfamily II helicase [Campylobacterota bacterium]|nr:primosomal protein N' (replication factor Y) - superfamily II helicase [Campylobacterota bacterium]